MYQVIQIGYLPDIIGMPIPIKRPIPNCVCSFIRRMLALKMDQHQEDEVEAEDSEAALEEVSLEVGVVSEVEEVSLIVL